MTCTLSELIGCGLSCRENLPAGEVLGFLLDEDGWALRYALVHLDGDPACTRRLLPSATFPPVPGGAGRLAACLTPEELRRGAVLIGTAEELSRKQEADLHDALHWQPYWAARRVGASPRLHDAGAALGARLTCGGQPFGLVSDLLVDSGTWTVVALGIRRGEGDDRPLLLPPAFITRADWSGACFDSDVRAAALACAPAPPSTPPTSDWLQALEQHLEEGRRSS